MKHGLLGSLLIMILLTALTLAGCSDIENIFPKTYPPSETKEAISPESPKGEVPDLATYPGPISQEPPDWQPQPSDAILTQGEALIENSELLVLEIYPPQYMLSLKGNLPTPCHQLRIHIPDPDEKGQIMVQVYSVVNPNEICIQVLEPFEVTVPLEVVSGNNYSIWVNSELVGEIVP